MAEIFGIVTGALSVAALFSNCVDCFELTQLGKSFGKDFESCQLKLDVAKLRLSRWGQAAEINVNGQFTVQPPNNQVAALTHRVLERIFILFDEMNKDSDSYRKWSSNEQGMAVFDIASLSQGGQSAHTRFSDMALRRQKTTSMLKKAKWAIYGAKDFDKAIGDIEGFISKLENLVPAPTQRRQLIQLEVEELDISCLQIAEKAANSVDPLLEESIQQRIIQIGGRNEAKVVETEGDGKVLVGNQWANDWSGNANISDSTTNTANNVTAKDKSAVQIGNRFGGQSFF